MTQFWVGVVWLGAIAADAIAPLPARAQEPTANFLRDVAADYKHFVSKDTILWLRVGGSGALGIHAADEPIRQETFTGYYLKGGHEYGGPLVQIPLAVGWWAVGHVVGGEHGAAGRDLLRAQISAASWTYSLKYIVGRTRPNGDPRSFPSGHASSTFATAVVLQQHYGWTVGAPALAAAVYTAASRITAGKHWTSDVVFGAAMGMASARTVTIRVRKTKATVSPMAVAGGGGVLVTAWR